ncbi:transposase DDE domain protein [mine drainage metagenome]|uniref:Transposase DDE domain protein n=1 Tax=mine drainage metagenome TaxID=410659 RepID=A0A1J5PPL2_9ZZZZ
MRPRCASLFSQILNLIDRRAFEEAVERTGSQKRSKGFGSWDQFVAMMFCQLAQAKSLREIEEGLACCEGKLRHLGVESSPARSTLSYANKTRPAALFEEVFYIMLKKCQELAGRHRFNFDSPLLSLDSTVIDLCAGMFDWARFRRAKGAVKLHLLLDHDGYLPVFAHISEGKVADVSVAQGLILPPGSIVVIDRGYIDYRLFECWSEEKIGFVTRLKSNAEYFYMGEPRTAEEGLVRLDAQIEFQALTAGRTIFGRYRLVRIWREDKQQTMDLLTNLMDLPAEMIAAIYKERWQIELFFKAIKQNLRIKTFVGTSANAVHIQIWTALTSILLVKYLQFRSRCAWALSHMVALLRWNLFTYRDLWTWLERPFDTPPERPPEPQREFCFG